MRMVELKYLGSRQISFVNDLHKKSPIFYFLEIITENMIIFAGSQYTF